MKNKTAFDQFEEARLSPEDVCRVFHDFAAKWQDADDSLDCRHRARTLCMYHFAAFAWIQVFSIVMVKSPLVIIARKKGSPTTIDPHFGGIVMQRERNTDTELVMGDGARLRAIFDKTAAQLGVLRTDHEGAFMAKDAQFLVHMFSYADNNEDFAHRAYTPLLDHGIEA